MGGGVHCWGGPAGVCFFFLRVPLEEKKKFFWKEAGRQWFTPLNGTTLSRSSLRKCEEAQKSKQINSDSLWLTFPVISAEERETSIHEGFDSVGGAGGGGGGSPLFTHLFNNMNLTQSSHPERGIKKGV